MLHNSLKRHFLLIAIILFLILQVTASVTGAPLGTEVGGPMTVNTVWDVQGSPYRVTSNVFVLEGVTLTIKAGVKVEFEPDKGIEIDGQLIARGNASEPIWFTGTINNPINPDEYWGPIELTTKSIDAVFNGNDQYVSGSILQHCIVEFGRGILVSNASPYITKCAIRMNNPRGIEADGRLSFPQGPVRIIDNAVYDNYGPGLDVQDGVVLNNTVHHNSQGIVALSSTVDGNNISFNSPQGIHSNGSVIANNLIEGNSGAVGGVSGSGILTKNTILGNIGEFCGGVSLWQPGVGYAGKIENNLIMNNHGRDGGGGICTSSNAEILNNIVVGNSSERYGAGYWGSGQTIIGNLFAFNYLLFTQCSISPCSPWGGTGIHQEDHVRTVVDNTIVGNYVKAIGVEINGEKLAGHFIEKGGGGEYIQNNIYGNHFYDVFIDGGNGGGYGGGDDVEAYNNYWGTDQASEILGNIHDWFDDGFSGKVFFQPFLSQPSETAPLPPPMNLVAKRQVLNRNYSWDLQSFNAEPISTSVNLTAQSQYLNVEISWDKLPYQTDGWGYMLYYDQDSPLPPFEGMGISQGDAPIDVGDVDEIVVSGLDPREDYYFAVVAYDDQGRESWYSKVLHIEGSTRQFLPIIKVVD